MRGKFLSIAEHIEKEIRAHKWQVNARLPSVRKLADQYQVALATAARALEVLHRKGFVRLNDRSGTYVVSHGDTVVNSPKGHWGVCLRVTPGPWHRASASVIDRGFYEAAHTSGVHFDFDAIPTDLNLTVAEVSGLVSEARKKGVRGLFFLPSRISNELMRQDERLLAACREAGLPVVLIERNLRGECRVLEYDLVGSDNVEGGFRCAMHLLEIGRRHLAFVRGGYTSSHNDMLAGFLSAQSLARQRGLLPLDAPFPLILDYPEGSASPDAYRFLSDRLVESEIDGVVCYQDRFVIGLTMELLTRGKRVPQDVALTGFDDQPIGQEFSIGVTTYAFPGIELVARSLQVMRSRLEDPARPPAKVLVPSRLIIRESSTGIRSLGT